jgi:vacuolar protein sorting-associated protein 13A/C
MELIGDPMNFFDNLGTGVAAFFFKTRSEMIGTRIMNFSLSLNRLFPIGHSTTKGEGVRRLSQAILTGTLASASKITGSLEEILKNATGLQEESFEDRQIHTASLSSGLKHGGNVFVSSLATGISGLVVAPMNGFQDHGLPGVVTGVMRGLVGFVAAPVTGALGAVAIVTESARQSAQFRHSGRPVGRRRHTPRSAFIYFIPINRFTEPPTEERIPRVAPSDWTSELPLRYLFIFSQQDNTGD